MKKFKWLLVLAALLLAAVACDDSSDDENGNKNKGKNTDEDTGTGSEEEGEDTGTGEEEVVLAEYTFDEDDEGFAKDEGADDNGVWTYNEDEGTMDLVFEYEGTGPEGWGETTFVQKILNGADWSEAKEVVYTIRVNEAVTGGLQPFIKTGTAWEWYAEWYNLPQDNEFYEYSLNLGLADGSAGPNGTDVDISQIMAVGIEVSSGSEATEPGTIGISIDKIIVK